jgi:hypothetical protein
VWFRKIPYLWPVNAPDSWLLNIAKFKANGMGLSLCAKNLQGVNAQGYQAHCTPFNQAMAIEAAHKNPNSTRDIQSNYNRHVAGGIPRWDKPGFDGGIWQEVWATRCIDNNSALKAGLHVIEGVYGRDGDGFLGGPNKGPYSDQEAWDYMTNYVIFGKCPYRTDIIGLWLGGHEAGNVGLYHIAMERKLSNVLDPRKIPVYLWENGKATLVKLEDLERKPLKTYYMQLEGEEKWRLLNEPFDYSKVAEGPQVLPKTADARVLDNSIPNPENATVSFEYGLPKTGHARLEILDERGKTVQVLADGGANRGYHMANWKIDRHASGKYVYRFRSGDCTKVEQLALLK